MIGRCAQCGENCKTIRATYCSVACKQKAYRARKKQEKIAKKNTMHMDDRLLLAQAIKVSPEFRHEFDGFYVDFGVEASVEMLHIVSRYCGVG